MKEFTTKAKKLYLVFYYPIIRFFIKLLYGVSLLVLFLSIALLIADGTGSLFGYNVFVVESESMRPALNKGDVVIVKKELEYNKDDIITYIPYLSNPEPKTVTHRIVEKYKAGETIIISSGPTSTSSSSSTNNTATNTASQAITTGKTVATTTYKTKGDNNPVKDSTEITDNLIKGKVTSTIPAIGNFVLFVRSIYGLILLIIVPATIILTLSISDFWRRVEKAYERTK